ncbi:MAG: flotillin family protein [Flavobacteriales bacterium]
MFEDLNYITILIAIVVGFFFIFVLTFIRRYRRCPSDKILVVYGKVGGGSAKCIHGGAAFIWPLIQDYSYLDLTPISIEVNLANALSKQNIRVDVPSRFTVGISTEPVIMNNAAERLLGLKQQQIYDIARDIIFGQLRLVVATMDIEEINSNRDKFLANVSANVEAELKKIGLRLINVNVTDIKDESGYIEALGKEAAAKAINDARQSVAEKNRDGSVGEANAVQEQRVKVAQANATAVEGENLSKILIANSDALRREKEAEAEKIAIAAEKVQTAKALEESYAAEREAETARAQRDKASQVADVIVPSQIEKERIEIQAEAQAEQIRRIAKGEADAILFRKQAEAQGLLEILTKQAEGLDRIVKAAGNNSRDAVLLLIADKLPEIIKTQAEAIKNIKIDKVTVWEGGTNADGKTSTANFISGLYKSVPPLDDMFKMAGMELPSYLKGKTEDPANNNDQAE